MPRYIDADLIPYIDDDDYLSQYAYRYDIDEIPTADVVPKSEVESLQAEIERLTINMNAYGLAAKRLAEENENLEIELENMRRNLGDAREGWNEAECEVERLRKALDEYEETSGLKQAKADVAREIFENMKECAKHVADTYGRNADQEKEFYLQRSLRGSQIGALIVLNEIVKYEAKFKKKYTGDQT